MSIGKSGAWVQSPVTTLRNGGSMYLINPYEQNISNRFNLFEVYQRDFSYLASWFKMAKVSKYDGKGPQGQELFPLKRTCIWYPFCTAAPNGRMQRERNFNLEDMNSHASSSRCSSTQPTYESHLFPDGTKQALQIWKLNCMNFACMFSRSVKQTHSRFKTLFWQMEREKKHCIYPNVTRLIKWSLFS